MKICVVLTARPSWAKLEPVCRALKAHGAALQLVVCASALLERYGNVSTVVEAQGYNIAERVYSVHEGATLETSALETGTLQSALARTYARLRPDVVVVCADRHEILAAAAAARMLELPVAHLQGGEVSGSVDNDIRDAVTQLSAVHLVATNNARYRVYGLTGHWDSIHVVGCPSVDLARQALEAPPVTVGELSGAGVYLNPLEPFLFVLQHPVTNEANEAAAQMDATLDAILRVNMPRLVMWPGQDSGADAIAKRIRLEQQGGTIHTLRNLPPERFLRLLTQASVLVGNSSAGIRESAYLGVPVVNIGTRQANRERAGNVFDVPHESSAILAGITYQLAHGPYRKSMLYGAGDAGERIAEVLCRS